MRYLVILFASYNNETADKKAIYEATSSDEAIAMFHQYMGAYMKDETVAHVMCMAINTDGGIYKNETFNRPSPVAE